MKKDTTSRGVIAMIVILMLGFFMGFLTCKVWG
jgi:hypothetical protein